MTNGYNAYSMEMYGEVCIQYGGGVHAVIEYLTVNTVETVTCSTYLSVKIAKIYICRIKRYCISSICNSC